MRTLHEIWSLAREAGGLWARSFPVLATWFCLGFATRELATQLATFVGVGNKIAGTLIFSLGLVAWVICLVLMIYSVGGRLRADQDPAIINALPGRLETGHRRRDVVVHGVAPFLAVYALGGFAEDQISYLRQVNMATLGTGLFSVQEWTIPMGRSWEQFGILAIGAWLALMLLGTINRRLPSIPGTVLGLAAKGTVVLASFVALTQLGQLALGWLHGRRGWAWVTDNWAMLLALLPRVEIFGELLPDWVRALGALFWNELLPGTGTTILLPLVWLALTATVFGWRSLGTNLLAESDAERALRERAQRLGESRMGQAARGAVQAGPLRVAWRWVVGRTEDFVPMVAGLRLLLRAGARFIGAYLVVNALLAFGGNWLYRGFSGLVGPRPLDLMVLTNPVITYLRDLLIMTLQIALYAAAFDRSLAAAAGATDAPRTPRRSAPGTPLSHAHR